MKIPGLIFLGIFLVVLGFFQFEATGGYFSRRTYISPEHARIIAVVYWLLAGMAFYSAARALRIGKGFFLLIVLVFLSVLIPGYHLLLRSFPTPVEKSELSSGPTSPEPRK